jgi:hypothetical protein
MPHPHDALLQAHIDGELAPAQMQDIRRHLASCVSCRAVADGLEQLGTGLSEAMLHLDATAPAEWRLPGAMPLELASAARGAELRPRPRRIRPIVPGRAASPVGTLPVWKWAAAALVLVTGAASAAVVGVPLLRGSRHAPAATAAARPSGVVTALRPAGAISIRPAGEMEVTLSDASAGSRLFVRVADQADVTVSVRTDSTSAEPARFRTSDARITVKLPRAMSMVEVTLPNALRSGRVLVGDRVVASVVDGRVVPPDAAAEGVPLVPSR